MSLFKFNKGTGEYTLSYYKLYSNIDVSIYARIVPDYKSGVWKCNLDMECNDNSIPFTKTFVDVEKAKKYCLKIIRQQLAKEATRINKVSLKIEELQDYFDEP